MSFATRLFLGAVAVLLFTVVSLTLAADRWLRQDLEHEFAQELKREARLVADALAHGSAATNADAHRFGTVLGRRMTFVAPDGRVIGDSDFDDASLLLLENHRGRPEIEAALSGGTGIDRRVSTSTHRAEIKVAVPGPGMVVRVSAPLGQVDAIVGGTQRTVLLAALAATVVGLGLAWFGGRALGRPLTELSRAARLLASGSAPTYPRTEVPEIRQLVQSFRTMDEDLSSHMADLRRGREETETLIESMIEGVIATDARGEVVACNGAARRLLSFGPGDALPNVRELFRHQEARSVLEEALAGGPVLGRELEFEGRTVLLTARPLPNGGAVLVLHDVSDIKRLEVVRRDFVANVSHELKTPLTNISGYAETLAMDDPDTETRKQFLSVILSNTRRMQQLVDDLLDLSRVESGRWQPAREPLHLATVVSDAWAPVAQRAHERGVELQTLVNNGQTVFADPEAIRQILTNLFDNSIRHTPSGGYIAVSVRDTGKESQIVVHDTGAGIPAEHIGRIFERFYRLDPGRSRVDGGTGLGLAIVKHLIEAHGGRVTAESTLGEGTTMTLSFPSESTSGATWKNGEP